MYAPSEKKQKETKNNNIKKSWRSHQNETAKQEGTFKFPDNTQLSDILGLMLLIATTAK